MNRQRQSNPPRAIRRRVRRPKQQRPKVVEIINRPLRQRAPPRRRGRNKQGIGIMGKLANGAMALLGKGIGSLISGFGDYKIGENTLMTGGIDPPTIVNSVNNGGVIVRHREYLQDITASVAFTLIQLPLNPGQLSTFPWLSAIAQHFEQYRFRGMLFEFKSLSSDAVLSSATSSALGSVVMATQYNALNPPFPNKFTMENYEFANSAKPSLSFIHPVECAKKDTSIEELYVRGGAPAANSDLRLYDIGNFSIATVGMQADGGVAGELWVTYEIELFKPKIENPSDANEQFDHFHLSVASMTNASPFTGAVIDETSTLNGTLSPNAYAWPLTVFQGRYLIIWSITGTATAQTAPNFTIHNCDQSDIFSGNTQARITSFPSTAARYFEMICLEVTDFGATLTYNTAGVFPTAPTFGDYYVIEVPGNSSLVSTKVATPDDYGIDDPYQDDEQAFRLFLKNLRTQMDSLKIEPRN